MADPKAYVTAEKRLLKLDKDLSAALDKLTSARADGSPADAMKARQTAEGLESKLEAAYHDAVEAHRAYWSEVMRECLAELDLTPLIRYRQAAYCRGEGHTSGDIALHHVVERVNAHSPSRVDADLVKDVPVNVPDAAALDRAEQLI